MSHATPSGPPLLAAQQSFLAELPRFTDVIRFNTRRWPAGRRREARDDMLAACWHAWVGLARRGKDPAAVGPTGIAANAIRYVRGGRKLGCGAVGRAAIDIYDPRARRRGGSCIVGLDAADGEGGPADSEGWRQWLACDHRTSPADEAAFRIDFAAWLDRLPPRKRRLAELLAEGHGTGVVARIFGVTPGAISQMRGRLAASWGEFQGEPAPAPR
jgi:hypothetical protein